MLNDFYLHNEKDVTDKVISKTIVNAKEIFGESVPYVVERRIDGPITIFSKHFLITFMEALSTSCIAKMTRIEKEFFFKYLRYQNAVITSTSSSAALIGLNYSTRDKNAVEELDKWLIDEIAGNHHPILNECFNQVFDYNP